MSTAPTSSVDGPSTPPAPAGATEGLGVFTDINDAVTAALKAADELARFPLSRRGEIIGKMRTVILDNLEYLSVIARDETGMGRVADKINKNRLVAEKTPGGRGFDHRRHHRRSRYHPRRVRAVWRDRLDHSVNKSHRDGDK